MVPRPTARAVAALVVLLPVMLDGRQAVFNPVQPQATPSTGLIVGRVVDAADGKPIARALVTMNGPARIEQKDNPILTDAQGRFVFANLPAGVFMFGVSADGYRPADTFSGRRFALQPDQKLGDVTIALARGAVIAGVVTDTRGEPLVAAIVRIVAQSAIPPVMTPGLSSINDVTLTDDLGAYRFANLAAADYLVVVPSSATTIPVSVIDAGQAARGAGDAANFDFNSELLRSNAPYLSTNGKRQDDAYLQTSLPAYDTNSGLFVRPTTYFDGAATANAAIPVRVKAGEERGGVDIRVPGVRGFAVEGTVDVPAGSPAHLGVTLLPADWAASRRGAVYEPFTGDMEIAKTVTTGDGRFKFLAVPPGDYAIRILRPAGPGGMSPPPALGPMSDAQTARLNQQPTLYALQPVNVVDRDVTGVSVSLRTGPRVSGHVVFVGKLPRPGQDAQPAAPGPGGRPTFAIRLDLPTGVSMPVGLRPVPVGVDGTFTTMSMAPGRYFIGADFPGQGWRLASAIANGRDVSRLPLDLESDVTDLAVTFVDTAPGRLGGILQNTQRVPDVDAAVYVFPSDYQALADAGSGALSRVVRQARPDPRGVYNLSLAPGSYVVAAVHTDGRPLDTNTLASRIAALGTRVTIASGSTQTLDLVTVTVALP